MSSVALHPMQPSPMSLLGHRVAGVWRSCRSALAAANGASVVEFTDDLTPAGLKTYEEELTELDRELRSHCGEVESAAERAIGIELRRFVTNQLMMVRRLRTRPALRDYLDLILLGLVLTQVDLPAVGREVARQRISAALQWLEEAGRLHAVGSLELTETDRGRAAIVRSELTASMAALANSGSAAELEALARGLSTFSTAATRQSERSSGAGPGTADTLDHVLLRTERSLPLTTWCDMVTDRLSRELAVLTEAEQRDRGIAWAGAQFAITDFELRAWADGSPITLLPGTAGRLRWMELALSRFRHFTSTMLPGGGAVYAKLCIDVPLGVLLAPNAMYLPAPPPAPDRLLLSTQTFGGGLTSRRDRTFLAMMIAHELTPGHAEHRLQARRGPWSDFAEVLCNPIGLEGWALYAENQVAAVDQESRGVCSYHLLRRLLRAAIVLTRHIRGHEAAQALIEASLRRCPAIAAEIRRGHFGSGNAMTYAVGLIETELAVARISNLAAGRRAGQESPLETYLRCGPIAPALAADVVVAASEESGS